MILLSPEEQTFYGKTFEEALAWCLVWLMAPELGIGPFAIAPPSLSSKGPNVHGQQTGRTLLPDQRPHVAQPFAIGDRVAVIATADKKRRKRIGRRGTVRQVYPYPINRVMECGVLLDGEDTPRLFHPSALVGLDPESDQ